MSQTITVQSVLDDAAVRFGDPNKTRFGNTELLSLYNDACEEISSRWQMIEVDASFSWVADEDRYSYPDDNVSMLRLQYNATPSDSTTWRKVYECTEEEYVGMTDGSLPVGDDKIYYWPRTSFFVVWPRPQTAVSQGGKIGYWKLADRQTSVTTAVDGTGASYTRSTIELDNAIRPLIRDRMLIGMDLTLGRSAEAAQRIQLWEASLDDIATRIESSVDDRRENFTPRSVTRWGNGFSRAV